MTITVLTDITAAASRPVTFDDLDSAAQYFSDTARRLTINEDRDWAVTLVKDGEIIGRRTG